MDDPQSRDDEPAVRLLEAIIARAHIDAARGNPRARAFLDDLTRPAEQALVRRLGDADDALQLRADTAGVALQAQRGHPEAERRAS